MYEYFLWVIIYVCLFLWMNNKFCPSQLGETGYGKMNMGHVGSPHCTLAHILVFFFCVTTGILLCLPERPVLELVPIRNLLLTLWKNRRVCGVKYLRAYWGSCSCWSFYFGYMEDCSFRRSGEARACQNFEIGGLFFHLALSSLRNFHAVAVFFHLL